jgi:hypothetical protein
LPLLFVDLEPQSNNKEIYNLEFLLNCKIRVDPPRRKNTIVQWKVLYHPPYSQDLSPCDFDLIPKMKEPPRGIRFRTVPEILQAVDRSIRTINTTGAVKSILRRNGLNTMLVTTL